MLAITFNNRQRASLFIQRGSNCVVGFRAEVVYTYPSDKQTRNKQQKKITK